MLERRDIDRRITARTALGALLLSALPMLASPAAVWAADPFYEKLLADGRRDLAEGRLEEAALDLEIACFGLLDEPTLLGEGLAYLALAQRRSGDTAALRQTIERLLEVERSHQGYSRAEIPEAVSSEIERILLDSVPPDRLAEIESLRPLAERRDLDELMGERPERRRQILSERLTVDPDDVRSLQLLSELEIEQGDPAAALPHLDALVRLSGGETGAVCRRFRVALDVGGCAADLEDVATCPQDATSSAAAPEVLSCLMATSDPARAAAFLESLEPPVRALPKVRKLERQLDRRMARVERAAAEPPIAPSPSPGSSSSEEPAVNGSSQDGSPAVDPSVAGPSDDALRLVRRRLDRARTEAELSAALAAALELADTYPQSRPAQFLGAEAAYRAAQWEQAVRLFDAAGEPDSSQPLLLFYKAVSLFESGSTAEAAACLERALPFIRKTDFVEGYAERILGAAAGEGS